MQQQPKNNTLMYVIITVVIIAGLLYFAFKGGEPNPEEVGSLDVTTNDSQTVGSDVVFLLGQINALSIDKAFFQSAVYKSLIDYTQPVPVQPVGRTRPFEPFDPSLYKAATPTENSASAPTTAKPATNRAR